LSSRKGRKYSNEDAEEATDAEAQTLHRYIRHIAVYNPPDTVAEMDDVEIED
jgi:hypothetical protein